MNASLRDWRAFIVTMLLEVKKNNQHLLATSHEDISSQVPKVCQLGLDNVFNLPELDPVAFQFDLCVLTPKILDTSVAVVSSKIARLEESGRIIGRR